MGSFRVKIPIPAGTRFGRLVVVKEATSGSWRESRWICRCDCGSTAIARGSGLRRGCPKSCGCLAREVTAARTVRHGYTRKGQRSPEWLVWSAMIQRCHYPKDRRYPNYGGRGIAVCERWRASFEDFVADMGHRPSPRHSLDRVDNDGPYSQENCRWANPKEQQGNKRNSRAIEFQGRRLSISGWADETGLPARLISGRLRAGWLMERVLITPMRIHRKLESLPDLSVAEYLISPDSLMIPCFLRA